MRITIDVDQPTGTQPAVSAPVAAEADGGPPAAGLTGGTGTGTGAESLAGPQQQANDAGPPPDWLVAAIAQAEIEDPGRFQAGEATTGTTDAADAGAAPAADQAEST